MNSLESIVKWLESNKYVKDYSIYYNLATNGYSVVIEIKDSNHKIYAGYRTLQQLETLLLRDLNTGYFYHLERA